MKREAVIEPATGFLTDWVKDYYGASIDIDSWNNGVIFANFQPYQLKIFSIKFTQSQLRRTTLPQFAPSKVLPEHLLSFSIFYLASHLLICHVHPMEMTFHGWYLWDRLLCFSGGRGLEEDVEDFQKLDVTHFLTHFYSLLSSKKPIHLVSCSLWAQRLEYVAGFGRIHGEDFQDEFRLRGFPNLTIQRIADYAKWFCLEL